MRKFRLKKIAFHAPTPGHYASMFDPKTLENFTGEMATVGQLTPGDGMSDRV